MASSLLSNMAWSNCMISAGLAPCLFPIAVFIVWRLKIVPGTVHALLRQGRNPKMRKNPDVIKFYDHSLGTADYSYFQAIFDQIDLYGETQLSIFCMRQATPSTPKQYHNSSIDTHQVSFQKVTAATFYINSSWRID